MNDILILGEWDGEPIWRKRTAAEKLQFLLSKLKKKDKEIKIKINCECDEFEDPRNQEPNQTMKEAYLNK